MTRPGVEDIKGLLPRQWKNVPGCIVEWWTVFAFRASISTLSLIVFAALLLWQGQARDVLSGIDDILSLSEQGIRLPGFRWVGIITYTSFWFTGFYLALILALVARVTGMLEFSCMTPEPDERRQRIVQDYSIFIFFSTLFVVHLAYAFSSVPSTMYGAVSVMATVSAIVLVPRFLLNRWNASPAWRIGVYLVLGTLAACFVFYLNGMYVSESVAATIVSCLTPAFALIAVLFRGLPFPNRDGRWAALLIIQTLLLSLMFLVVVFVTPLPSTILNVLYVVGSVSLVFVWLAWFASILACCLLIGILSESAFWPTRFFFDNQSEGFTYIHSNNRGILVEL